MSWINSKFSVRCTATAERCVSINNAWNGIISGYTICSTPGSGHENRSRSYIVITREICAELNLAAGGCSYLLLSLSVLLPISLSPSRPTVNSGSNWSKSRHHRIVCSICFAVVSFQTNLQSGRWRGSLSSLLHRRPRSPRWTTCRCIALCYVPL